MATEEAFREVAGRSVRISSPSKLWFPDSGVRKIDVVDHYIACADGARFW
jgi:bifunctional non-homologous end joining protein LigD